MPRSQGTSSTDARPRWRRPRPETPTRLRRATSPTSRRSVERLAKLTSGPQPRTPPDGVAPSATAPAASSVVRTRDLCRAVDIGLAVDRSLSDGPALDGLPISALREGKRPTLSHQGSNLGRPDPPGPRCAIARQGPHHEVLASAALVCHRLRQQQPWRRQLRRFPGYHRRGLHDASRLRRRKLMHRRHLLRRGRVHTRSRGRLLRSLRRRTPVRRRCLRSGHERLRRVPSRQPVRARQGLRRPDLHRRGRVCHGLRLQAPGRHLRAAAGPVRAVLGRRGLHEGADVRRPALRAPYAMRVEQGLPEALRQSAGGMRRLREGDGLPARRVLRPSALPARRVRGGRMHGRRVLPLRTGRSYLLRRRAVRRRRRVHDRHVRSGAGLHVYPARWRLHRWRRLHERRRVRGDRVRGNADLVFRRRPVHDGHLLAAVRLRVRVRGHALQRRRPLHQGGHVRRWPVHWTGPVVRRRRRVYGRRLRGWRGLHARDRAGPGMR